MEKLDHKIDPLGTSVLQSFKALPGLKGSWENAVIAGGYVRDSILKKPFKDIDIFIPNVPGIKIPPIINDLPDGYKYVGAARESFGVSEKYNMNFSVFDFKYLESVSVQVIMTTFPSKDFTERLLKSFDYGICQAYFDGIDVYSTKEFLYDMDHDTATLLTLDHMNNLPKYMKRFFRIQEKYPTRRFRCPELVVVPASKTPKVQTGNYTVEIPNLYNDITNANHILVPENYLSMGLSDILTDGGLNWHLIDDMMSFSEETAEHANALLNEWDIQQG